MSALLQCLSHTPLINAVGPVQDVLDEVGAEIRQARERIARFTPELIVLFAPDHYNGFFYDIMPSCCIGMAAHAIGDFGTAAIHQGSEHTASAQSCMGLPLHGHTSCPTSWRPG